MPEKNIYWRDITPAMRVEDTPTVYIVHLEDGTQAVAYWEGREAVKAQFWLRDRARLDAIPVTRLMS